MLIPFVILSSLYSYSDIKHNNIYKLATKEKSLRHMLLNQSFNFLFVCFSAVNVFFSEVWYLCKSSQPAVFHGH